MFWCYWWVWMVWMIVSGLLVCRLCPPAIVLMPTRTCKNCISEELPVFHHNCTVSSCTLREALALHCWHWVTRPLLPRGSIVLVYLARYQIRPDQTISPYHWRPLVTLSSTHSEPNQTKSNQSGFRAVKKTPIMWVVIFQTQTLYDFPDDMNDITWRLYSLWGRGVNLSCEWLLPAWCVIAVMTERPR